MTLDAVFAPEHVAVFGASATRPGALGTILLRNAAASGLTVAVVHPTADEVDGHPAAPELSGPVDLALVSVPAEHAVGAVAHAAEAGSRAAIVLSSGFGEAGPEGAARQGALDEVVRATGIRVVGPNCMGVLTRLSSGALLSGSYFWDVPQDEGRLSFVTQSGAFGGMLLSEVRRRGAGLARFLSVGNAADVGMAEVLEWLADDPATGAVGVFLEGIDDGPRFVAAARRLADRVPVVAIKAGRTAAGARAAASHTGSLAGAYGGMRAAMLRAGVRAETDSRDFFDALFTAAAPARSGGPRIAIVTISGGPSVLAADAAEPAGLVLADLAPATRARLRELVPAFAADGNPVDLTPQCPPAAYGPAFRAVAADPGVDGIVVIDCGLDVEEIGAAAAAAVDHTGKRATAYVLDAPRVAARLVAAEVPLLGSPEAAVRAHALPAATGGAR